MNLLILLFILNTNAADLIRNCNNQEFLEFEENMVVIIDTVYTLPNNLQLKNSSELLDRVGELLKTNLSASKRPEICPLKSKDEYNIKEKLKEIHLKLVKGDQCGTDNKNLISGLGEIVNNYDNFMKGDYKLSEEAASIVESNQSTQKAESGSKSDYHGKVYVNKAQDVMNVLSGIVQDDRCAYNVKQRGLIPVIADVITNFSQLGILAPTPIGLAVAGGGVALGSTINILNNLFSSKFDWGKDEDQEEYLKLICAYYDTSREMEKLSMNYLPSEEFARDLEKTHELSELLEKEITNIEEDHRKNVLKIEQLKNEYLSDMLGKEKVLFAGKLFDYKKQFDLRDKTNKRPHIPTLLKNLQKELKEIRFNKSYEIMELSVHLDKINNANLYQLAEKNDDQLTEYFLESLKVISDVIDFEVEERIIEWQNIKESEVSNGDIEKTYLAKYETLKSDLLLFKNKLLAKRKILEKIQGQQNFTPHDGGSFNRQSIFKLNDKLKQSIFGKQGGDFLRYVISEGTKRNRAFVSSFKKFKDNYITANKHLKSEHNKVVACATAKELLDSHKQSKALANMATDFLDTNAELFYEDIDRTEPFLSYFRGGRAKRNILKEQESLILTREKIENKSLATNKSINGMRRFKSPRIGSLMNSIINSEVWAGEVQRFYLTNSCMTHQ